METWYARNREKVVARTAERKVISKAYVAEVRTRTVCQRCGVQPIDWHREEHLGNTNRRIGAMMSRGVSPEEIQREIDPCTLPLCLEVSHDDRWAT